MHAIIERIEDPTLCILPIVVAPKQKSPGKSAYSWVSLGYFAVNLSGGQLKMC